MSLFKKFINKINKKQTVNIEIQFQNYEANNKKIDKMSSKDPYTSICNSEVTLFSMYNKNILNYICVRISQMITKNSSWSMSYISLKLAITIGLNRNFLLKQVCFFTTDQEGWPIFEQNLKIDTWNIKQEPASLTWNKEPSYS